jgi:hypothetical protein
LIGPSPRAVNTKIPPEFRVNIVEPMPLALLAEPVGAEGIPG